MQPTHINAFVADVEDKRIALVHAQSDFDAAVKALEEHPDYVAPVEEAEEVETVKSLSKTTKAELLEIVTAEEVEGVTAENTNKEIIAAIEAKRALAE